MKRHVLMAVVVTFATAGLSYSQTGAPAPPAEKPKNERAVDNLATDKQGPEWKQSLSKSLEKAGKEIGDTLQKTNETVRETLGLTKQGCLKRGDEADPYLLEESETAEAVTVVGSADLAKHVNHMVRLHGREEAEGHVFHVTTVEQIAASCDPLRRDEPGNTSGPRGGPTAGDQGISAEDRRMTQTIRQAVVRDGTLSMHGRNIKIISQNGFVTLRGLVRNEEEKRSIEAKAVAVAGAGNVSNGLTVQASSPAKDGASGK